MSYDVLRDDGFDESTVTALVDSYGLTDHCTGEEPPVQVQAELLEAINQFGSQTMDDTVKRDGMWALIRALGIIEATHDLNTTFVEPVERSHPDRPEGLIDVISEDVTVQSILEKRQ